GYARRCGVPGCGKKIDHSRRYSVWDRNDRAFASARRPPWPVAPREGDDPRARACAGCAALPVAQPDRDRRARALRRGSGCGDPPAGHAARRADRARRRPAARLRGDVRTRAVRRRLEAGVRHHVDRWRRLLRGVRERRRPRDLVLPEQSRRPQPPGPGRWRHHEHRHHAWLRARARHLHDQGRVLVCSARSRLGPRARRPGPRDRYTTGDHPMSQSSAGRAVGASSGPSAARARWIASTAVVLAMAWSSTAAARTVAYAIAIGNNAPPAASLPVLRYADDDAVRYHQLFSRFADDARLLAVLDDQTQRRYPALGAIAGAPTLANLARVVSDYAGKMAADVK